MKVTIIQTLTKTLTQDRTLLTSFERESFLLEPDEGKIIKNIKTGKPYPSGICIAREKDLTNFEEVECQKDSE